MKLNTPGYKIATGCSARNKGYCLFAVSDTKPAIVTLDANTNNPPWYPSLELLSIMIRPFARTHPQAQFAGSYSDNNNINTIYSPTD